MLVWIVVGLIVVCILYNLFQYIKALVIEFLDKGNVSTKLILASLAATVAFGILMIITGLPIMGVLAQLCLSGTVVVACVQVIFHIFKK